MCNWNGNTVIQYSRRQSIQEQKLILQQKLKKKIDTHEQSKSRKFQYAPTQVIDPTQLLNFNINLILIPTYSTSQF